MKVVITGVTGFLARSGPVASFEESHPVLFLRSETDVHGWLTDHGAVSIVRYDGTATSLIDKLAEFSPDLVLHLVSNLVAEHRSDQVIGILQSNIVFGCHLLEAMLHAGRLTMIKTGTFWQFYQSNGYNPVCLYAASKQAFQTLCEYYVQAHVFRLLHLYLFDTYGPGDTCRKLIHLVAGHAGKSEVLPMSPGEQRVNLLHISDVVNGFEAAIGIRLHDFEAGSLRYALAHDE